MEFLGYIILGVFASALIFVYSISIYSLIIGKKQLESYNNCVVHKKFIAFVKGKTRYYIRIATHFKVFDDLMCYCKNIEVNETEYNNLDIGCIITINSFEGNINEQP